MNLATTSLYTGLATALRTISGFLLNKILAMYLGPSGLAFIGQFQSFIQMILQFASGAIHTGVIKYTSEHRFNENEKKKIFSTSILIGMVCSLPISLILLIFADLFSDFFFKTENYSNVFRVFAITLFLYVLNTLLLSILNGQQDIKRFNIANVLSSFIGLLVTGLFVYYFGLEGALYSLVLNQSLVLATTLLLVIKSNWFHFDYFTAGFDRDYLRKLSTYTAMAVVSSLVIPLSHIFLRNYAGEFLGWEEVGYWEAMTRVSNAYLVLLTTTLSVYYLPKLSEINDNFAIRKEIFSGYKIILPVLIVLSLMIYVLRNWIVLILFSETFLPMTNFFAVQLMGDVFKISSWLIANLMLAKAMSKLYILSEILFSLSLVTFSIYMINVFGIIGLVYGYCLNYCIYLLFNMFCFRDILFRKSTTEVQE